MRRAAVAMVMVLGCANTEAEAPAGPEPEPAFVVDEVIASAGGQADLEQWEPGTYVVALGEDPRQLRYRVDAPVRVDSVLHEEFTARVEADGEVVEVNLPVVEVPFSIRVDPVSRNGVARIVATAGEPRIQLTQETFLEVAAFFQREMRGISGARGTVILDAVGHESQRESELETRIVHPAVRMYLRVMDTYLGTLDLPRSAVGVGARFIRRRENRETTVPNTTEVRYEVLSIESARVRVRFELDSIAEPTKARDDAFGRGALVHLQRGSLRITGEALIDLRQVVLLELRERVILHEEYLVEMGGQQHTVKFDLAGGIAVDSRPATG